MKRLKYIEVQYKQTKASPPGRAPRPYIVVMTLAVIMRRNGGHHEADRRSSWDSTSVIMDSTATIMDGSGALKKSGGLMDELISHYDDNIVISTSRLTKAFGNLVAVNDLHLQVMRGDVFGFLGPNGSGKTTTIRMLLGLIRPSAGRAVIFNMDNAYQLPAILQRVGAIVETPVFYPYLSGKDNLHAVAAASGMISGSTSNRRVEEVLEFVELGTQAKQAFRNYSLGMKQRLGIGAALLSDPELLLLDEPTNGLDPAGQFEIRQLIQRLSTLGKTIFIPSHFLHEIQHVCNRVPILQKGNLIKQD